MATESEFYVQGLSQFRRALARVSEEFPASLREFNVKASEEIVAVGRHKAESYSAQAALAAKSLRATRSASYAAIKLGDNRRYAFARGAEWGARKYKQFPAWRGNQWMAWEGGPGYFLHPAIREVGETVLDQYWDSIRALRAQAFPD